jgi:hypothetical protein
MVWDKKIIKIQIELVRKSTTSANHFLSFCFVFLRLVYANGATFSVVTILHSPNIFHCLLLIQIFA